MFRFIRIIILIPLILIYGLPNEEISTYDYDEIETIIVIYLGRRKTPTFL
jgi:hypothetical protein